ncbi:MAG: Asp23/Gls24 family envelope stress response protein [Firmicutes bacterium]|nr:Asp23/Gls24 family envelope stress response protein [Bacillota bacterium]
MIIYGLSGKSGTGKSYNAIELCARMGVKAIIDDGLFIDEGVIVAGTSAKKQKTKVGAIKTAIFEDPEQARQVSEAVAKAQPKSILVLGTSDRMVDIITDRLGLPKASEYIHIEDITTKAQRAKAREVRDRSGMHVIPAPTLLVRKQFSGYFLNPRRSFGPEKTEADSAEKTVMRPKYSYLGKFEISEKVISDIVGHIVAVTPGASQVIMAGSSADADNNLYIRVIVTVEWGSRIRTTAYQLQKNITEEVARMTNLNINGVAVEVRGFKAKGEQAV